MTSFTKIFLLTADDDTSRKRALAASIPGDTLLTSTNQRPGKTPTSYYTVSWRWKKYCDQKTLVDRAEKLPEIALFINISAHIGLRGSKRSWLWASSRGHLETSGYFQNSFFFITSTPYHRPVFLFPFSLNWNCLLQIFQYRIGRS